MNPLNPNPGKGPAMGIPVPLFNLVYHDALLMPWSLCGSVEGGAELGLTQDVLRVYSGW